MLSEVIQKSDDSIISMWNETQKCLMKWVDLMVEWTRFGQSREERKVKIQTIGETIEKVNTQLEMRDNLVQKIDEILKEQPNLIMTVEQKIAMLKEKK